MISTRCVGGQGSFFRKRDKNRPVTPVKSGKKKKDYRQLQRDLEVVNIKKAIAQRRDPDNVSLRLHAYRIRNIVNMNYSERLFKDLLELSKIQFIPQRVYVNGSYGYLVDFFLPQFDTCVEIDGGYHDDPQQKIKDQYKDRYLISQGLKVLRIEAKDVKHLKGMDLLKKLRSMKTPATYYL